MSARHRPSRWRGAGFTLLELLVVLGLAALAVTVVGGGAQAYLERARYQQTVRDLASQLNQARSLSMDVGKPVLVSYVPQTRQLRAGEAILLEVPDSVTVQWQALRSARLAGATAGVEPIFIFNSEGGARGGAIAVSRAGRGVEFRVNWLLGTIDQSVVGGAL
ncbi:prepilin-type N-terminal cleavage/methylation domain-containing protein [Ottowia testudinis]|uniref:Type II secretion system protein H n=2 Tax=Ottowia testudinis TaxID=2816950 RepID=A0A975CJT2_9BURK|nr:prepilin-type N-terminal cleavage/methylation domain-containing protein [Ottowia testudinis]